MYVCLNTCRVSVPFFNFKVEFWAQHVSFLLVGIIVITSIRGLLITLTKVVNDKLSFSSRHQLNRGYVFFLISLQFFYALSSSKSSNILVLCLAEIMVGSVTVT